MASNFRVMSTLPALAFFPKFYNRRFRKLAAYFSDLEKIWSAEFEDLARAGIEAEVAHEFIVWRESRPLEYYKNIIEREGITTISINETDYPPLLKQITDPPHTLFIRGQMPRADQPTLAIVGTRRVTSYGRQICDELAGALARQGLVIVSGLAYGVDGIAHEATLKAGGITVAVLGTGVDRNTVYPTAHRVLAERIIDRGGAVISEYPPGFLATQYSFPARNRVIAGLSLGTLVIEAPTESGALITAKVALDYNREVMAVPHSATSLTGVGGNNLLKFGAHFITEPNDVLEALNLAAIAEETKKQTLANLLPIEEKILGALTREPKHIDEIILQIGLDSAATGSALTMMEIKGLIKNLGGMKYITAR
ncbi:MAG: DNA-processing protein DprA [Patescibacteria group bacterium]|nr:DNA-processing protein DprA [Patescibacteria group bacterium]